jgi:hypothetical protein
MAMNQKNENQNKWMKIKILVLQAGGHWFESDNAHKDCQALTEKFVGVFSFWWQQSAQTYRIG